MGADKPKHVSDDWESTFNAITDLVSIHDLDLTVVRSNKAFNDVFGMGEGGVCGLKCHKVVHGTDEPVCDCPHREAMERGEPVMRELWEPRLKRWLQVSVSPMRNKAGKITGSAHVVKDITVRKQMEKKLLESEHRFRGLFEEMQEGYAYCRMIYDDQGKPVDWTYLNVNRAFEKITGLRGVEGRNVTDVIPGIRESDPVLLETYGRVASTGIAENFEINFTPLGMWLDISVYSPVRGHFVAVFENVTEKHKATEELRNNEKKYRQLLETVQEGIWVIDAGSVTTYVNPKMAQILGYEPGEMVGRHLFSFMDEQGKELAEKLLESRRQGLNERHAFEFIHKSGARVYALLETGPIMDDNGGYVGAIAAVADVTGIKKIREERDAAVAEAEESRRALFEAKLQAAEDKYRIVADNTYDWEFWIGPDDRLRYSSPSCKRITGYTAG
ncbi:MAG: PAS domain S-box protein, partial [Myxococcota bacterium]